MIVEVKVNLGIYFFFGFLDLGEACIQVKIVKVFENKMCPANRLLFSFLVIVN